MATYHLNEAKANLSALVAAAEKGAEVIITRYGKPVARLAAIKTTKKRVLGFYPIEFKSDLLASTDAEIIDEFYQ